MKAHWSIVAAIALILCAAAVPAHADSVTYNFSYTLISGGSSVGTVTGSFNYNSSTFSLSNSTITFNSSLFGNVTLTQIGSQSGSVFAFGGVVGGNFILYFITINPLNPSQYWVSGTIINLSTGAYGQFSSSYTSVPEGGAWYVYLVPSLLAMFGGMLLAGRRPRRVEALQAA